MFLSVLYARAYVCRGQRVVLGVFLLNHAMPYSLRSSPWPGGGAGSDELQGILLFLLSTAWPCPAQLLYVGI